MVSTETTPLLEYTTAVPSERSTSVLSSPDITPNVITNTRPGDTRSENVLDDEEVRVDSIPTLRPATTAVPIGRIVSVLLIGSFISAADGSLMFATHPIIASEFNALHDSTWLMTSYNLAQAATQPLYGKLSDIYGRKSLLFVAYTLFAVGMAVVGSGQSMPVLIAGRTISGAGCSGMMALLSILITDLVPLRDVASWRSYVNIVVTTGRSVGGPLGGWLADTVGWRWSFLGQVPLPCIAIILIGITVPSQPPKQLKQASKGSKFARIDFVGATFMTISILSFLFPLEIGGDQAAWNSPIVILLLVGAVLSGAIFLIAEGYWAKEPIIPLPLLSQRDVVLSGLIMLCQSAAQIGLMFAVPLYFQVTSGASNTVAGAHLVPAVVGNTVGGLISGTIINRSGRYKLLISGAAMMSCSGYLLLILRWHGSTNWLESLYIFPTGFGMGTAQSALFISVQAAIDPSFTAIATSILYLASSIGNTVGMASAGAVLQNTLQTSLEHRLDKLGFEGSAKARIIEHAVSDVHYVDGAKPLIAKAVTGAYVDALTWTHVGSLACSLAAFVASLFIRQHRV